MHGNDFSILAISNVHVPVWCKGERRSSSRVRVLEPSESRKMGRSPVSCFFPFVKIWEQQFGAVHGLPQRRRINSLHLAFIRCEGALARNRCNAVRRTSTASRRLLAMPSRAGCARSRSVLQQHGSTQQQQ